MNKKSKLLLTSLATIAMSASLVVGGTYALFTDKADVNVAISSGSIDVTATVENAKVYSGVWNSSISDYESVEQANLTFLNDVDGTPSVEFTSNSLKIEKMTPMDKVTFDIRIQNGSTVKASYQTVVSLVDGIDLFSGLKVSIGDYDAYDGMTAYSPWETMPTADIVVPVSIELPNRGINEDTWESENNKYMNKSCEISYSVRAVQGNAHVSDDGAIGTETNTKFMYNANDFELFARSVANGNDFTGETVKLMQDVTLGGASTFALRSAPVSSIADYLPIDGKKAFNGTFDGNGKVISGMNISGTECVGLFGRTGSKAVIKNVTLDNATISGNHYVGGIVGWAYGRVENCIVRNSTISATPNMTADGYDNGDKVGGIVGYGYYAVGEPCIFRAIGNTVENTTISGYRDLGGIAGMAGAKCHESKLCFCGEALVRDNTVKNVSILVDQFSKYYGVKDANAGAIIGRNASIYEIDPSNVGEEDIVALAVVDGTIVIPEGYSVTITGEFIPFAVSGAGTLVLNDAAIAGDAETKSALTLNDFTGKVEIEGAVSLTGAQGGSGIYVSADSKLDLSGNGTLVAIGNDGVNDAVGGNGIGGSGEIYIHDLKGLVAKGYGKAGFGIGGESTSITIVNTKISYAAGGYVQKDFVNDTSYGKSEPEGGAAIGSLVDGAVITLEGVTADKIEGGSKSAGIGARYWTGVSVVIKNSTLKEVIGGNASAGIGGSRVTGDNPVIGADDTSIVIVDSKITAIGGQGGAGIGSGYDTHCGVKKVDNVQVSSNPMKVSINISGNSVINATGGKYAAGIGTGFHHANMVGYIADTVTVNATSPEYFYKDSYTKAQGVGFGVVDMNREGLDSRSYITYQGERITLPVVVIVDLENDAENKVLTIYTAEGFHKFNTLATGVEVDGIQLSRGSAYTIKLGADIDMSGYTWTTIDHHADTPSDCWNTIDGNGYTISNLTINGQGMFSRFAGTGDIVIKNLTFDNAKVTSSSINTSILCGQAYQNVTLDNVDVKNSTIQGGYKVATLIATVYNESSSTVTLTMKNCDVENTTVISTSYDFCTAGLVAFVYEDDNDKVVFENCTLTNVTLKAIKGYYQGHAFVYTYGGGVGEGYNEVEGVTVTGCTFENL